MTQKDLQLSHQARRFPAAQVVIIPRSGRRHTTGKPSRDGPRSEKGFSAIDAVSQARHTGDPDQTEETHFATYAFMPSGHYPSSDRHTALRPEIRESAQVLRRARLCRFDAAIRSFAITSQTRRTADTTSRRVHPHPLLLLSGRA